jgi:hypothetical protein
MHANWYSSMPSFRITNLAIVYNRLSLKQGSGNRGIRESGNPGIGESDKNFIGFNLIYSLRACACPRAFCDHSAWTWPVVGIGIRKSNLNSLFSRTTRTVEVMKNIIRREQSTNSATSTNKVLLKYNFRLSVVQIYLWSSVLVSKTTLGGRPWSARLRFISDGILKLPCTPGIMNVSRKKRLANVLIQLLYLTITIKAMKYHITSWMSAGKSDLQTCYRYYIWQSQSNQSNEILYYM